MLDCISIAHDIVVPAIISAPVPVSFSVVHAIFAAPATSAAPAPFAARGSSVVPVFSVAPAISDDLAVAVALAVFADPRASAALKIVDAPAAFVARAVFDALVASAIPVDDAARDTFAFPIPAVCTATKVVLVVEVVAQR